MEVVTVAYVSNDDRVGNSLVQIWKLKFGHKVKFLFRHLAKGLVKIVSSSEILEQKFGHFCCCCLVEVMKFILVEILKLGLVKILNIMFS